MKNIYQTVNAVMADIGAIGKDKVNQQQRFNYRGVDDVMNALNPAFIRHGLFLVPEVLDQAREERQTAKGGSLIYSVCRVKYTFYAEDGSSISTIVIGEGMDSGDKASNKALSAAFKYACFQVFCIATEELKDPDSETPEPSRAGSTAHTAQSQPQRQIQPQQSQNQHRSQQGQGQARQEPLGSNYVNTVLKELERTGTSKERLLKYYNITDLSHLTIQQYRDAMIQLKNGPTVAAAANPLSDSDVDMDDAVLPWNDIPQRELRRERRYGTR